MLKKVKGLIVQAKDEIKILTSVYAGSGADENIKNNVVKGLENFKFTHQESTKQSDFLNYVVTVNGNSSEEMAKLKDVIASKSRQEIQLGLLDDKVYIINIESIAKKDDENFESKKIDIMGCKDETVKYLGFINLLQKENGTSSIGMILSTKNDDSDKIKEFESLGFKKMVNTNPEYANSEWSSYSGWINKPTEYEVNVLESLDPDENGKYKKRGIISLNISDYGVFKNINQLISIEDIPEKVDATEAEAEAIM